MGNLSQERRDYMLKFLNDLRLQNLDNVNYVRAINEIENAINDKKYGLVWESHTENVDEMLKKHIPVLVNVDDKAICSEQKEKYNFLIEGDNLHSLKLLKKTYKGRVDIIYIDPPYNRGKNDFVYNDVYVDKNDEFKHSKWLSFMYHRLSLAKELLVKTGVVFISIDDNEQAALKLLCNEIFGESNVETMIWAKESESNSGKMKNTKRFRDVHEYIIACYKNKDLVQFSKINEALENGQFQTTNLAKNNANKSGAVDRIFEIVNPDNGKSWTDEWKYDKDTIDKLLNEKLIWFGKTGNNKPRQILPTDDRRTVYVESIITQGSSTQGRKDLESVLGKDKFDNPKPVKLLKTLFTISGGSNSIILDFFAGSGTTGEAVVTLNREDKGNRTYILCTNNQNRICETITYQRLLEIQKRLPHNLKYFKTEFVDKVTDDDLLEGKLIEYIKPLIELEYFCNLDTSNMKIVLTEENFDELLESGCIPYNGKLFIASDILASIDQQNLLAKNHCELIRIPEYYYKDELIEAGEL